jgi:hypothetical protein
VQDYETRVKSSRPMLTRMAAEKYYKRLRELMCYLPLQTCQRFGPYTHARLLMLSHQHQQYVSQQHSYYEEVRAILQQLLTGPDYQAVREEEVQCRVHSGTGLPS